MSSERSVNHNSEKWRTAEQKENASLSTIERWTEGQCDNVVYGRDKSCEAELLKGVLGNLILTGKPADEENVDAAARRFAIEKWKPKGIEKEIDGQIVSALHDDSHSFKNAVSSVARAANKDEIWIQQRTRDLLEPEKYRAFLHSTEPMSVLKGSAIMTAGLGEHLIEKNGVHYGVSDGIGLGKTGIEFLSTAEQKLSALKEYALSKQGQTVDGVKIDSDFFKRLDEASKYLEQRITRQFGGHGPKELEKLLNTMDKSEHGTRALYLIESIVLINDLMHTANPEVKQKLMRDLAAMDIGLHARSPEKERKIVFNHVRELLDKAASTGKQDAAADIDFLRKKISEFEHSN